MMSNQKQLTFAWLLHAEDNAEVFAYACGWDEGTWVTGLLDFTAWNASNWDVTRDIQRSPLWNYCSQSAGIFRCPADKSTVRPNRFANRSRCTNTKSVTQKP